MGESFKRQCFTHPLINLSSVVSNRFLGQAELDFGLRHSLKWEVGCALHHPRKIPERLDTSLSHNSLFHLGCWPLPAAHYEQMPSCHLVCTSQHVGVVQRFCLSPTPSWSTCSSWGKGMKERRAATPLLLSPLHLDSVLSSQEGVLLFHLLCGCGWNWSQISPQFVVLISTPFLRFMCSAAACSQGKGPHLCL